MNHWFLTQHMAFEQKISEAKKGRDNMNTKNWTLYQIKYPKQWFLTCAATEPFINTAPKAICTAHIRTQRKIIKENCSGMHFFNAIHDAYGKNE